MIILGLGSNAGDRLNHLRMAYNLLRNLAGLTIKQVSPIYISDALLPENSPTEWDIPYLNCALRCESKLEPLQLLRFLKEIEEKIGRNNDGKRWSPREIDIDILAFDDQILTSDLLTLPHTGLLERPFALWPLADVAPEWLYPVPGAFQGKTAAELVEPFGSRFQGQTLLKTQQINQRVDTPKIIGIINVTPDSFSDGGKYFNIDNALEHAELLVKAGADMIDIGAESTAPRATPLVAEDEWARLEPVLKEFQRLKFFLPTPISVDTRYPETAEKALGLGASIINDVTGYSNPQMLKIIADAKAHGIVMHHLTLPPTNRNVLPRNQDPVQIIYQWAKTKIAAMQEAGIAKDKIILDPGIGFGKTADQSMRIIKNFPYLNSLDVPWMVGHSRKSFLSQFTKHQFADRDIETTVLSLHLLNLSVDYVRVHNVEMTARAFKVAAALR